VFDAITWANLTPVDVPDGSAAYTNRALLCQAKQINLQILLQGRERVAAAGLGERVTVLFEDYRELAGRYDQLVSIEMIEAVGHRWFDTYFRTCSRLLAPDGQMLLQAITIRDQEYARTKRSVDFIQRHVFPGGCLPSVQALADAVARVTDLRALHLEDIGPHYATTLRHWRERFLANLDRVRALGFD
ncbi:MAG: class I SAM-dependent methyltransferase, partial [Gemmatimonadetes bacterium]|nr:class I SAM-dependent methyltransferase [Gemmatimonadota bacterium]